ncbi:methyltransferase domain-containing protein [Lacibacter sp. MH-610]|uniref:class I SAM-dependent methyltransferase n=1 Tax=Lacibacter sp. MH-610 TaxID=3020883 RepID=UPI00389183DD
MTDYYHSGYFSSSIFDYDYAAIAETIIKGYQPKRIIDFGCGTGDLAKAFASRGVTVEAIDGYSTPDFSAYSNIHFTKVDLNNTVATQHFLEQFDGKFDLAISIEVAEHLNPAVSSSFIEWMTSMADVIVFSAAVPSQDGDGHINCRSRSDWYQFIKQDNFVIADTLRQHFISNPRLGLWHKLNIVDYLQKDSAFAKRIQAVELTERLIAAETFAASQCFHYVKHSQLREWALGLQPVKAAVQLRNMLTRMLGKTSIEF